MINEFERVRIKKTGVTGTIVDIREGKIEKTYTVETDEKGVPGGWWEDDKDACSLIDCKEDELEKIDEAAGP